MNHIAEIKMFISKKKDKHFNISSIKQHLDKNEELASLSKSAIRRIMVKELKLSYK